PVGFLVRAGVAVLEVDVQGSVVVVVQRVPVAGREPVELIRCLESLRVLHRDGPERRSGRQGVGVECRM
ncbi:MAG TPA: hypothetical protein VIJ00_02540, partial [Nakamurella sp.]